MLLLLFSHRLELCDKQAGWIYLHVADSVHLVHKEDDLQSQFLFAQCILLEHPSDCDVQASALVGAWIGTAASRYDLWSSSAAASAIISQTPCLLDTTPLRHRLCSLENPVISSSSSNPFYVALGGPGVRKTVGKLLDAFLHCARAGQTAFILSTLTNVRNMHVRMLADSMEDLAGELLLVKGSRNLDALARLYILLGKVWSHMKTRVYDYEQHLDDLLDTLYYQDFFRFLRKHLHVPLAALSLIDAFGGFSFEMRRLHDRAARERCSLDTLVKQTQALVMEKARIVVSTTGTVLKSSTKKPFITAVPAQLDLLAFDEGSHLTEFEKQFTCAHLSSFITPRTTLALVGDPTQLSRSLKCLPVLSGVFANAGVATSSLHHVLQQAFDEKLDAHAFVQYFDFLNRYRPSHRCPLAAAEVVSSLAPLCLPGPRELWSTLVDHKKVWEDLQPRDVSSALDKYLRRYVPEVLLFDAFPKRILRGIPVPDRIGTSRIQLLLVLPAVAAALWLGRQIFTAKHDCSLDQWHSHFASREDARA